MHLYVIIEAIAQLVERTDHNSNCKCSSHFSLIDKKKLRVSVIVNIFSSCLKEKGANPLSAYIYIHRYIIIIVFSFII